MSTHEIELKVVNRHGLHARPATAFVQLASKYDSQIEVTKGDLTVDGKSITSMLTLGAEHGTALRIRADGNDAAQAVEELAELLESGFGED